MSEKTGFHDVAEFYKDEPEPTETAPAAALTREQAARELPPPRGWKDSNFPDEAIAKESWDEAVAKIAALEAKLCEKDAEIIRIHQDVRIKIRDMSHELSRLRKKYSRAHDQMVIAQARAKDEHLGRKTAEHGLRGLQQRTERAEAALARSRKDAERYRDGLRWYAGGHHYDLKGWEGPSGDDNWLCPPNEELWMVEDGSVARAILNLGHRINPLHLTEEEITIPPGEQP